MTTILSIAIDALAFGMVLFIISVGLSVMMGLVRVVNLAHGAFAMIGGYIASAMLVDAGAGFALSLLVAVAGTIAILMPVEYLLYRRIYRNADAFTQILMTIGLTFLIIGIANTAFGPTSKPIPLPAALSGPLDIGFRSVPAHYLLVICCGALTALALWFLLEKTQFGTRIRASVDNAAMAEALGIRTEILYAAAFALAVGLAALGGVLGAQLLPIEPYYALRYMVVFLVVVSVGGAGSILGAIAASLILGLASTLGKYLAPEYGDFFFYLTVILVVFVFPHGLFGAKE